MDVVDKIATVETHPHLKDHPADPVAIRTVQVFRQDGWGMRQTQFSTQFSTVWKTSENSM